jgi:Tfp pilus assembly protein PilO
MKNLAKVRQQFTLILGIMGAVDLLLIIYLLLPGSSPSAKMAQEENLRNQKNAMAREVTPLRGIDDKLKQTREDVKKFYEQKVPNQYSEISQHIEKITQESGVSIQSVRYTQDKESSSEKYKLSDVKRIDIDTTVTGEYAKVAGFINAMERDRFVFIIDQITLNSQDGGVISLQIKFQTFLRET